MVHSTSENNIFQKTFLPFFFPLLSSYFVFLLSVIVFIKMRNTKLTKSAPQNPKHPRPPPPGGSSAANTPFALTVRYTGTSHWITKCVDGPSGSLTIPKVLRKTTVGELKSWIASALEEKVEATVGITGNGITAKSIQLYLRGVDAEELLDDDRKSMASCLIVADSDVYFLRVGEGQKPIEATLSSSRRPSKQESGSKDDSDQFVVIHFVLEKTGGAAAQYAMRVFINEKVGTVKEKLAMKSGISVLQQEWQTYSGVIMSDSKTLKSYFLKSNDKITVRRLVTTRAHKMDLEGQVGKESKILIRLRGRWCASADPILQRLGTDKTDGVIAISFPSESDCDMREVRHRIASLLNMSATEIRLFYAKDGRQVYDEWVSIDELVMRDTPYARIEARWIYDAEYSLGNAAPYCPAVAAHSQGSPQPRVTYSTSATILPSRLELQRRVKLLEEQCGALEQRQGQLYRLLSNHTRLLGTDSIVPGYAKAGTTVTPAVPPTNPMYVYPM